MPHAEAHAAQIRAQIDSVERLLALETRSRVLDLACGSGRQTLELARRGHRVLGVDMADAGLSEARHAARRERLTAHFLKNDIRQISYRGEFDAVVMLFSSFGRFAEERDDLRVLQAAWRGLKPGGRLLLDVLNREWLIRRLDAGGGEQAEFDLETGRHEDRRLYALTELKALLAQAGLEYVGCFGGFDGCLYRMDSPRLVVLARREGQARAPSPREELPRAIKIKGRRKR